MQKLTDNIGRLLRTVSRYCKYSKRAFGVAVPALLLQLGCNSFTPPPVGSYSEVLLVTEEGAESEWAELLEPYIARELDYYIDIEREHRTLQRIADAGGHSLSVLPAAEVTDLRDALDAFVGTTQRHVNGTVRVRLYKGDCRVTQRRSPCSLYDIELATYGVLDTFGKRQRALRVDADIGADKDGRNVQFFDQ